MRQKLKVEEESLLQMSDGKKFQRQGAEELKSVDPLVVKGTEGALRWTEEDLRVQMGVVTCKSPERCCRVRLRIGLKRILKS